MRTRQQQIFPRFGIAARCTAACEFCNSTPIRLFIFLSRARALCTTTLHVIMPVFYANARLRKTDENACAPNPREQLKINTHALLAYIYHWHGSVEYTNYSRVLRFPPDFEKLDAACSIIIYGACPQNRTTPFFPKLRFMGNSCI